MENVLVITYASSLTDFCEFNSSFDKGVLGVAYPGVNRNKSNITKAAFEKAIKSMYNVPVVCHYIREEDKFGGHDMDIVADKDGKLELINLTEPVGVVPESARHWWGNITEQDGTEREYLFTDVLLWKRQQAYRKIKEDGITAHSMEITVKDGELVDGIFNVYDFEFTAFCLIGVTPCFPDSALEVFSSTSYQEKFKQMMQDLKEINYSVISSQNEVDNINPHDNSTEGGTVLEAKLELAKEYSIDVESLDFNIDDFTEDELREKFEAMAGEKEDDPGESEPEANEPQEDETPAPSAEGAEEAGEPAEGQYALTGATVEEICRSLSTAKIDTDWGTSAQYIYVDCDFEVSEVYCWDVTDWLLYGFKFSKDGDNIVIDFESKSRKKFAIVDFDEGEQGTQMAQVFEQIKTELTARAEYKDLYNDMKPKFESLQGEVTELRAFKQSIDDANNEARMDEALKEFSDMEGIDAFDELMKHKHDYELEDLVEKCFAIRGRNMNKLRFSDSPKAPKIKVSKESFEDMPYGGIVEKYRNK